VAITSRKQTNLTETKRISVDQKIVISVQVSYSHILSTFYCHLGSDETLSGYYISL